MEKQKQGSQKANAFREEGAALSKTCLANNAHARMSQEKEQKANFDWQTSTVATASKGDVSAVSRKERNEACCDVMTASEIVQMYKEAKEKRKQIKILAELNLCSQEEIKRILRENGVRLPGGSQPKQKEADLSESQQNAETPGGQAEYSNMKDLKRIGELEAEVSELRESNKDLEDDVCELRKIRAELEGETAELQSKNEKLEKALKHSHEEVDLHFTELLRLRVLADILSAIDFDGLKETDSIKLLVEMMAERVV